MLENFGEPQEKNEIKNQKGEIVAEIWQYSHITKNSNDEYYKTTEFDIIGNKVNLVAFINTEIEDIKKADKVEK